MRKFLLILMLFAVCLNAYGQADELEMKSQILESLMTQFQKYCIGANGEVLKGTVLVDKNDINSDGYVLNCDDEARRLHLMMKELESLLAENEAKVKECLANEEVINPSVTNNIKDIDQAANKAGPQCIQESGSKCASDIACNVLRSSLTPTLMLQGLLPKSTVAPKCLSSKESSCAVEFINGIIQDLWSNLEGIWDLAKLAGKGIKNLAVSSWEYFTKVEDKTSDAAHAASKQSPSMIEKFKKDPLGFFKQLAIDIWNGIGDSIKNSFGCEKWEGAPHFSKCLQGMSSWKCANCNQKMNAICGIGGVLGGELLVAYFTGGTVNIASKIGTKAAPLFTKASAVLLKYVPKIEKVKTPLIQTGRILSSSLSKGMAMAKKVLQTKTAISIKKFVKNNVASITTTSGKAAVSSKPLQITIKVVKGATYPIRGYIKLLDKSAELGFKHASVLGSKKLAGRTKFSQALTQHEDIGNVGELVINSKQFEDISQDVLRSRLKENGFQFDEVTMPDGSPATRVKIDPLCSKNGKTSFLFR